jgi:hypothetical protein
MKNDFSIGLDRVVSRLKNFNRKDAKFFLKMSSCNDPPSCRNGFNDNMEDPFGMTL